MSQAVQNPWSDLRDYSVPTQSSPGALSALQSLPISGRATCFDGEVVGRVSHLLQ